jgi:hypothetical protein
MRTLRIGEQTRKETQFQEAQTRSPTRAKWDLESSFVFVFLFFFNFKKSLSRLLIVDL